LEVHYAQVVQSTRVPYHAQHNRQKYAQHNRQKYAQHNRQKYAQHNRQKYAQHNHQKHAGMGSYPVLPLAQTNVPADGDKHD
jgi:hypothetical protein